MGTQQTEDKRNLGQLIQVNSRYVTYIIPIPQPIPPSMWSWRL